jgi:hypothetical protein
MINATEMAKPFSKRINNFLRQKSTQEYILLLEERYADEPKREVLRVIKGGEPELQGTWMDEKLALKFAAWLAPMFELWLFDKIYELLTTGKTEIKEYRPANILKSLRLVVEQLEEQEKIYFTRSKIVHCFGPRVKYIPLSGQFLSTKADHVRYKCGD